MEILLVLSTGCVCILCFYLGLSANQEYKEHKEETKIKSLNLMQLYRERQTKKEAEKEMEKLDIIAQNIDNYDGTSNNQKDIPK